ncbi:TIGR02269 family lipoprotein [Pyxidicoccus trucidator]|uniref:SitA6 family polymorphic toxin lipoprotein n=1 Tax=Pyxidicoccus trucidator TaxID=2709662 RepID=UPI0013DB86D9|nr:TIGR02269 family lipoprotein [Pyxidicoccus trucidator]
MRTLPSLLVWFLTVSWLGCATPTASSQQVWDEAVVECDEPDEDQCVTLLCGEDACGLYRCADVPGDIELARFPPSRPPAAAAAPGSGPRRNWGRGMGLPNGAEPVMVFPNWNGTRERVIPPSHQLSPGRFEKHHIFPQAKSLADWFNGRGVRIHDYTMPIPRDMHRRLHGNDGRGGEWNKAWRDFKSRNEYATPEQIYKHAGELIYRFQLLGGPVQPYYSSPGT